MGREGRERLQASGKSGIIPSMKPDDSRITTIQVLYFARLREAFGRDREELADGLCPGFR